MKFKFVRRVYYFIVVLILIFVAISLFSSRHTTLLNSSAIASSTSNNPAKLTSVTAPSVASSRMLALSGRWQFMSGTELRSNDTLKFSTDDLLKLKPTKQLPNFPENRWQEIEVPANWWLEGHDLNGVVWYRHQFPATPELKNRVVKSIFEAVDYTADVWLNGEYLGFHEGYFQPFGFLVSDRLNSKKDNELIVK